MSAIERPDATPLSPEARLSLVEEAVVDLIAELDATRAERDALQAEVDALLPRLARIKAAVIARGEP